MATAFASPFASTKAVRISPIPDKIRRLQVISCDFCEGMASFDAYLEGVISGAIVLKRYCESCIKNISQ